VLVTTAVGPRVLGLLGPDGNVLAVLPGATLDGPAGAFSLIGGHRLWASPELPEVTYQPDDRPCAVAEIGGGVRVEAPVDGAGLVKAIEVRGEGDGWVVDHSLRNRSAAHVRLAPWAITQLPLGGEAMLPNPPRAPGFQADRSLVLWPYTDPSDPRIHIGADVVRIESGAGQGRLKLGAAPSEGA
jgi:hypothetical protein